MLGNLLNLRPKVNITFGDVSDAWADFCWFEFSKTGYYWTSFNDTVLPFSLDVFFDKFTDFFKKYLMEVITDDSQSDEQVLKDSD